MSLVFPFSHRQLCFRKLAMRHFPSATAISFALAAAVWAAPAAAQDAPVGPAVEDSGLSDIVVTAQRREERSEEHTSELQSLMRISYAVFCLKKKKKTHHNENIEPS